MIMVKKITMMQQRSTEQRPTVDSKLSSDKLQNVSWPLSEVLTLNTVRLTMLNQVLIVSAGTFQQFVADAVKISNIFVF